MAPNNTLSIWGNEKTMNLNSLILTNIQSSPYFKVKLYELKTYHEVVDEIYYKVTHLEPWEKGSRKTAGQTGMCGGVRGVGAGGIVSSAYCLLYKLFTLRLTRKQVCGLLDHNDSPYIRGLGFMYLRYTQDPKELWDWFEPYLDDEEEIDVKAGGGHIMTIGEMARQWLSKLEWYSTLFPRIPVPVQKDLVLKFKARSVHEAPPPVVEPVPRHIADDEVNFGEAEKYASHAAKRGRSPTPPYRSRPRASPPVRRPTPSRRSPPIRRQSPSRRSPPVRRPSPQRYRSPSRHSAPRHRPSPPRHRRSRSPQRKRVASPSGRGSPFDFARELEMERERQNKERRSNRSQSRERHRSKDRYVSPPRDKYKHRSRSKSREKHRHKHSSKSQDKHSKHRSRSRERHSTKHKEKKSSKHRSRSRSRERKKHKERRRSVERNGHNH